MKKIYYLFLLIFLYTSCFPKLENNDMDTNQSEERSFKVLEVIHTSAYTYLMVNEGDEKKWFALPLANINAGETYYYENGMEMKDFPSRELNRTFETIYFLESISTKPLALKKNSPEAHPMGSAFSENHPPGQTGAGITNEKKEVSLRPWKEGVRIGELFSKKNSFDGKTVQVKGVVVKVSSGIMNKNWIHLQDGTEFEGKFDLTVNTNEEVQVGDTVIFEGKVHLDKDLGYGYFFDIIIEDALLK